VPKSKPLDLSSGSVLHIKDFSTRGHPPKNKYCLIIGEESAFIVLAFLLSSQRHYLEQATLCDELVVIPQAAVHFLPEESFIQCFTLEKLDKDKLSAGYETGGVDHKGKLGPKYLYKVRDAVKNSKVLTQEEIEMVLAALNLPK